MFRTALRSVLAHRARLLMTVLAVLLGVAFVSGTLVFTETLGTAYRNESAKSYQDVAVAVMSTDTSGSGHSADDGDKKGSPGIDRRDFERIAALHGVASATGRVSGFAGVADREGALIGNGWSNAGTNFAPGRNGTDPAAHFTEGAGPAGADDIALDRTTARKGAYQVGDRVRVATNGPVKEYTLTGVFTTEDGAVKAGGSLVLFDTPVAQRLFLKPGFFDEITLTAAAGVPDRTILKEVEPLLPDNATAKTGSRLAAEQARQIDKNLSSLNELLLAFAGIALFVGIFLISNTFTMLVAQRTRELALLRAVGASRRQVKRSVLIEAAVVGAVASVAGFALGVCLAIGLRSAIGAFGARMPAGPLIIAPDAVGAALAVGVLVTVLAAWLPARRAAKIPPVAAMNSRYSVASTRSLVLRNSLGGAVTLLGAAGIVAGAAEGSDGKRLIAAGALLALVGVIVLIPLLSRPVIALVQPLLRRVFGVSGSLAGQNAVRNPRRTGATASALAIGLTLITGLSVLGATLGRSVDHLTTDNVRADYQIRMASGDGLDGSVPAALAKAPGVTALSVNEQTELTIKGSSQSVSAVTPAAIGKVLRLPTVSGSLSALGRNQIAVGDKAAASHGWRTGQTLPVVFNDGRTGRLTIGAVYRSNMFLSSVLLPADLANAHDAKPDIREVWLTMAGGASAAHEQALVDALGRNPAISVDDRQDIRNNDGGTINTALNLLYGLLAMALLIAVLGVVNTLAMSVFERRQEIGMLRAIGLDRGKVKRMIRLEAVAISVFGALIGVLLGSFLAWAIGRTVSSSIPDYTLVIPWDRLTLFLLAAGLVGVIAAMWPARTAARLDMLTAIKSE